MQKQAPSLRRILVMVGFALSCFGLLLFLWLAFGGPVPLKPKGYRFEVSFKEAGQLAQEADVRISGVSVGKVKSIKPDKHTGLSDAVIEMNREAMRGLSAETELEIVDGASHLFEEPGALDQVAALARDWLVARLRADG